MSAYSPADWSDLYGIMAEAAAVLTGLLFTALSLGPRRILQTPEHRGRAREALFQLVAVLLIGILAMIPHQGRTALGIQMLVVGAVMAFASARFQTQTIREIPPDQRAKWLLRVLLPDLATLAILIAGISLLTASGGGLYWLIGATLTYLVWSCVNAWQLIASAPGDNPS